MSTTRTTSTTPETVRRALADRPGMTVEEYLERQAQAEGRDRIGADSPTYRALWLDWLRRGSAMPGYLHDELLRADQWERELRDLGVATDAAGGYTAPRSIVDRLISAMRRGSATVRAVDPITTSTGTATSVPLVDDTVAGAIVAEAGAGTVDTAAPFSQVAFPQAYAYHSRIVRVSWQLANDSAFDLGAWLPRLLGARIGRGLNPHTVNGTGAGQPLGFLANVPLGKQGPAGTTTTIRWQDLVDVVHAVPVDYREDRPERGLVGWQVSDGLLKAARSVVDTAGMPVVRDVPGEGSTLLGYPVVVNPDMPAPAANARTAVFGHWPAGYLIRQVTEGPTVLRLSELYAGTGQVGWIGFSRVDGRPGDPLALAAWQHSAT